LIAHLRGQVEVIGENLLVLDVGGVGFAVKVPASLSADCEVGQQRTITTELIVREDDISIYGFSHGFERELFRLLTSITGVGPKLALKVLGASGPADLAHAISEEDDSFLVRIPGIGSKTAKRIVIELSEKISKLVETSGDHVSSSAHREAESVLVSLGCTPEEARAALEQCLFSSGEDQSWTAERLVIEAMKHMGGH